MSQALNNLLTLLNPEKIEEGLFRGQSEDLGLRRVFGGRSWGKRYMPLRRPFRQTVWCTHSTATFYAPVTALNRLCTTWKFCVTAKASALAVWRPSSMGSPSST